VIGMAVSRFGGWFGDDNLGAPEVELDTALTILRNERRRMVVRYVSGMPVSDHEAARVRVRDLAEVLAAAEENCAVGVVPPSSAKSVYVALIDTHLPKLDAVGVLDYDDDRKTVGRRPAVDSFVEYLNSGAGLFDTSGEAMLDE